MNYNNKKAALLLPLLLTGAVSVQAGQNYVPGIEAIKGAAAPGPGVYYKAYGVRYNADESDGLPDGSEVTVNALAHRFIWVTEQKILDADLIFESILPMVDTDLKVAGAFEDDQAELGDLFVGSVLSWHSDRWDSVAGAGIWSPTGNDDSPAAAGKGYSELMMTFGANFYLDNAKNHSLSLLSRYEIADDDDVENNLVVEYGLGTRLSNGLELGFAGYSEWEQGGGDTERHAAGFEASYFWPQVMTGLNFAAYKEYGAKKRFEGDQVRLALTKVF